MSSYNTPNLRTLLSKEARAATKEIWVGNQKYGGKEPHIGMTLLRIEQGQLYAEVNWGIDGTDIPVSPDVEQFVVSYDLNEVIDMSRASGVYTLHKGKTTEVLAKALVIPYGRDNEKSDIRVSGAKRKDVVKLFELIRGGKVRPDIEHEEFEQVEGNLNELRRLRRRVPTLESQVKSRDETIASMREQLKNVRVELAEAQTAAATN